MTESIANRIRRAIAEAGHSQTSLAREIGVTRAAVSGWVSGRYEPTAANLVAIATVTGADRGWLVGGVDEGSRLRWMQDEHPDATDAKSVWMEAVKHAMTCGHDDPCETAHKVTDAFLRRFGGESHDA